MNRPWLAIPLALLLVPGLARVSTSTAAQVKVVDIPVPGSGIVTERIEVPFDLEEDHPPIQEIRLRAEGDFSGEFVYECLAISTRFTLESGTLGVIILGPEDPLSSHSLDEAPGPFDVDVRMDPGEGADWNALLERGGSILVLPYNALEYAGCLQFCPYACGLVSGFQTLESMSVVFVLGTGVPIAAPSWGAVKALYD